jgi:hypothetical protein
MRAARFLLVVAVLIAGCDVPPTWERPSAEQIEAEQEWYQEEYVPRDYLLTAREVRALYEDEYPRAVMEWVDLVWDNIYYEGIGLVNQGDKDVSCFEYCDKGVPRPEEPPTFEDPLYALPGDHCFGPSVSGPEFVWCLLDARFAVEERIPDLQFGDWKTFMDYECRLAESAAGQPITD